jgi:hypothetical protein
MFKSIRDKISMLQYLDNSLNFTIAFFILVIIVSASSVDIKKNSILFKNGAEFTCDLDISSTTLKLKDDDKEFIVSLKNGWSLDGDHFMKDPFLIRADRCEHK